MAGRSYDEGIAEAEVEDDLRGKAGVRAAKDDREGVLGVHQFAAPEGVPVRMP
jgi:hypothetical protein